MWWITSWCHFIINNNIRWAKKRVTYLRWPRGAIPLSFLTLSKPDDFQFPNLHFPNSIISKICIFQNPMLYFSNLKDIWANHKYDQTLKCVKKLAWFCFKSTTPLHERHISYIFTGPAIRHTYQCHVMVPLCMLDIKTGSSSWVIKSLLVDCLHFFIHKAWGHTATTTAMTPWLVGYVL